MAKKKGRAASAADEARVDKSDVNQRIGAQIDVVAAVAAVLIVVSGWFSRHDLNPDGVSYLDIAASLQRGDWSQFAQGYWSPLMPFIIGVTAKVSGLSGPQLIPLAHALNVLAALGALGIVWRWVRRDGKSGFGLAAIAALLLCSYGLRRMESVTPDVLLLAAMAWLSYELLARSGVRWLVVGILLGVAFLAKTSTWPLLLLLVPLRLLGAPDALSRRRVWRSACVGAAIMTTWVVPMSIKAGALTLGSSGRLNFSWYFLGNDSGLPDRDTGRNQAYQETSIGGGRTLTLAVYDDATRWTYQPWGDPTAWSEKVLVNSARSPTLPLILRFWARAARVTLGRWLLPLIVAVLVPVYLLQRRRGMWRELRSVQRDAGVVMILGMAGVGQFIAIHPEPRLVAPFALMMSLGSIRWCFAESASERRRPPALRTGIAWVGIIAAVGLAAPRLANGLRESRRVELEVANMRDFRSRMAAAGQTQVSVGVVGPAAPLIGPAFRAGARIAVQLLPASVALVSALPREEQADVVMSLFRGKASLLWVASGDGRIRMLPIQPQQLR